MYKCGWNGCEKAYGTLNHLNAHVTMQSHGAKRTPEGRSYVVTSPGLRLGSRPAMYPSCVSQPSAVFAFAASWNFGFRPMDQASGERSSHSLTCTEHTLLHAPFHDPADLAAQSSKRFVRSGRLARKRRRINARPTRTDSARRPRPAMPRARTLETPVTSRRPATRRGCVHICHRLDMHPGRVRPSRDTTPLRRTASSRCSTTPAAPSTRVIPTRRTGPAIQCTNNVTCPRRVSARLMLTSDQSLTFPRPRTNSSRSARPSSGARLVHRQREHHEGHAWEVASTGGILTGIQLASWPFFFLFSFMLGGLLRLDSWRHAHVDKEDSGACFSFGELRISGASHFPGRGLTQNRSLAFCSSSLISSGGLLRSAEKWVDA